MLCICATILPDVEAVGWSSTAIWSPSEAAPSAWGETTPVASGGGGSLVGGALTSVSDWSSPVTPAPFSPSGASSRPFPPTSAYFKHPVRSPNSFQLFSSSLTLRFNKGYSQWFFSTIFRQFQVNYCRNFELEENFGWVRQKIYWVRSRFWPS